MLGARLRLPVHRKVPVRLGTSRDRGLASKPCVVRAPSIAHIG